MDNEKNHKEDQGEVNKNDCLSKRLVNYFVDNPIKIISMAIMFFGGLILLMYFIRIGFMPDIDFKSSTSLIYAVALLGMFFSSYMMLMMVVPGLVLFRAKKATKNITARHIFCITIGASICWAVFICNQFGFIQNILMYGAFVCVVLLVPALGVWMDRKWSLPNDAKMEEENCRVDAPTVDPLKSKLKAFGWSLLMIVILAFFLTIPILFIGVIGMTGEIRNASNSQAVLGLILMVLSVSLSAGVIAAGRSKDVAKFSIVIAPSLMILVLVTAGNPSVFSFIAIKALGQGEIRAGRLVVSGKTCREINQTLGQNVCVNTADERATAICPVTIRSRIGSQALLEFAPLMIDVGKNQPNWVVTAGKTDDNKGVLLRRRVILDKAKLLSWQPLEGFGEENIELAKNASIPAVATWIGAKEGKSFNALGKQDDVLSKVLLNRCGAELEDVDPKLQESDR